MKYIDEFRNGDLARHIAQRIQAEVQPGRQYRFMEFCGGHTHAISRYGVLELLPPNLRMIHGPGCPVCVLPIGRVDMAIDLALNAQGPHPVTLCTYGDTMRVPASGGLSLTKAKARGADVRMVYSAADALALAQEFAQAQPSFAGPPQERQHPLGGPGGARDGGTVRQVVFFAIGFETTTPPTALVIRDAARLGLTNFSVMCNHVLTPPAIRAILDGAPAGSTAELDGFVGPAHVSVVIGSDPYARFAREYRKPVVIAGFEPLDVLQAILMLVRQVNDGRAEVENEFTRAVTPQGNLNAQQVMDDVFELRDAFEWRGLGTMPLSALRIRERYRAFDAEDRFGLSDRTVPDNKACECGAILRGVKRPQDCAIFGTVCTPENPVGSCMVSSEGACAAHYTYGRFRDATPITPETSA
jgi:hydrogenase expression/formation protein HypD